MATKQQNDERTLALEVRALIEERPEELQSVLAYAFSQGGRLLDMQALDAQGNTKLAIPVGKEAQMVRVLLGPELDKQDLTVAELLRRGAIDKHLPVRPNLERLPPLVVPIGPDVWRRWIGRFCVVNGTLLKRVTSGGVGLRLPVCNAIIDIYEVDPWLIILPKLPDFELERLRDIVVGPWPPIHWPIPPRPPEVFLTDLIDNPIGPVSLNPQPLPPRELRMSHSAMLSQSAGMSSAASALMLPADLQIAARADRPAFERAILANLDLLRPWLCWLYPLFVRKTRIATVTTDECGHFHALIWRSFLDFDVPDLYFIARQRIWPGFTVTIYEPKPVACHTWWNYVCGTEVTLVTTHPLAHACPPCPPVDAPNNWVLFMAVGNTSVWRIHGVSDTTIVGGADHDPAKVGLLDATRPWGGTLRPRLEFDNSLRSDLGVFYYRVSYKRPTEAETAWRPSVDAINRHYTHEVGGDLILEQFPLGPQTVGASAHLYEIPPALPPLGQWSIPNAVLDTQSAVIPTTAVAPGVVFDENGAPLGSDQGGLWQIKVELFNSAGALVDPEGLGIKWRVPNSADLSGTIGTRDAATLGLVNTVLNYMAITVRVDNNPTYARIDAPSVGGSTAADACGVMNYAARSQLVDVPFVALQINRFASYSFEVQRGAVRPPEYSLAGTAAASVATMPGAIPPSPPADPQPTVDTLLDACNLAGFSELLYVTHAGFDGWNDLSQYNSQAVRAFVLAPAPTPTP